jgi:RimJ/RimL family protein N-acetyltransferase
MLGRKSILLWPSIWSGDSRLLRWYTDCARPSPPFRPLPEIETQRLRLRALRDSDADALFALFSDPQVMRYWRLAGRGARATRRWRMWRA